MSTKGRGKSTSGKVIQESKNWGLIIVAIFLGFALLPAACKSATEAGVINPAVGGAAVGAAGGAAACKTFCNRGGGGGAGGGGGSSKAAKEKEAPATTAPPPTQPPAEEDPPEETRIRPERTFELAPPRRGGEFRPPAQPGLDWQPVPMPGFVTQ